MRNSLDINEYVKNKHYREAMALPDECVEEYAELAHGEYNMNYVFVHPVTGEKKLLRVNAGSQMHLNNQIIYEAKALGYVADSGRTPNIYYVDGGVDTPGNGVLVEEFLPGGPLDIYDEEQMRGVMACFADIHSVYVDPSVTIKGNPEAVDPNTTKLIAPTGPMRAILEECESMLSVYLNSELPEEHMKARIRKLLDNAWKLIPEEGELPYRCCVNTEVNPTNFLVREDGYVYLIDWEKPVYGDPAQDLAHFLAPTTTFWKEDLILTEEEVEGYIDNYLEYVDGRFDTTGLKDRILAYIPVTCLRGITWCAQGWVEYRSPDRVLTVESTRIKVEQYLEDKFLQDIENRIAIAIKSKEGEY